MMDLAKLNLPAIVRHYMLANTPRYLYRHLRADPSVESLAESSTPKELLRAISAREKKPDRTTEDVAIAYAMLVALSFHKHDAVEKTLANCQPTLLTFS